MIVDNNKITTEVANIELCSSACDVAKETCSSQNHDTCGDSSIDVKSTELNTERSLKIGRFRELEVFFWLSVFPFCGSDDLAKTRVELII